MILRRVEDLRSGDAVRIEGVVFHVGYTAVPPQARWTVVLHRVDPEGADQEVELYLAPHDLVELG